MVWNNTNKYSSIPDLGMMVAEIRGQLSYPQKSRYFTKKELKYHVPEGNLETAWQILKLSRSVSAVHIPYSPLPLTFVLTPQISGEIHICDQELSRVIHADEGFEKRAKEYFAETFSEEAISSSKLEGAATTEVVAREMLRKNRLPKNKDEQMIVNNHRAMMFIREHLDAELTPEFICEIQRIVTENTIDEEKAGVFRTSDDIRVVNQSTGKIIHEPPKAVRIPEMISALCEFVNQDRQAHETPYDFIHPIVCAITLHFLIGYIHPFYDGNGRTARTLFYWYVLSRGYSLFEYIPISKIIKQAPAKYRNAYLATEEDDFDLTYFIEYNVDCIRRARTALGEHIAAEKNRTLSLQELVSKLPSLSDRQRGVLIYLLEHKDEWCTTDEISLRFGVVYQTARTDLMHLADLHYLQVRKEGRTFLYKVSDDWAASVQGSRPKY